MGVFILPNYLNSLTFLHLHFAYSWIYLWVLQPTYQNQRVIHETMTTSTTKGYPQGYPQAPSYSQGGSPSKTPSLNNNLSELESLMQDLSNGRYASTTERRGKNLHFFSQIISTRPMHVEVYGGLNIFTVVLFFGQGIMNMPCLQYFSAYLVTTIAVQ